MVSYPVETRWTHVVLNYLGPHDGIQMFMDGVEVVAGTLSSRPLSTTGNGRIVVGKGYTDRDDNYSSVQVDELIFFNSLLKPEEIDMLVEEV